MTVVRAPGAGMGGTSRDEDADPAEYGGIPHDTSPDEAMCLTCGRAAIEHTRGRFSIYGICPDLAPDDTTDLRAEVEREVGTPSDPSTHAGRVERWLMRARDDLRAVEAERDAARTDLAALREVLTVNAEHVRAAWDQAGWIEVDDPNGPEYGTVRLPLNEASRVERFLAILGVEVHP